MNKKLLVVFNDNESAFQNEVLEALYKRFLNYSFVIICKERKLFSLPVDKQINYANNISDISIEAFEEVQYQGVVIACKSVLNANLWLPIHRDALDKNIKFISVIDENLKLSPYSLSNGEASKGITVFPGSILPLNMGSHQRAFNLLLHLNLTGIKTDALITAGKVEHAKKAQKLLETICPNVYTYKNTKRKLNRKLRFRRWAEKKIRNLLGYKANAGDLFEERLYNKATFSAQKTLARILTEHEYDFVIVNYAWMSYVKNLVPLNVRNDILWICDTHDVQFQRNQTQNKKEFRLFYSEKREKKIECNVLDEYDNILAISKPDFELLQKEISPHKVTLVTSGFDYSYMKFNEKNVKTPFNFGFIGGSMEANVRAVEHILKYWWPTIMKYSPDSKFYIAGSICNVGRIKSLCFFHDNIIKLGFVNSLKSFYSKFDISLNPVFVQGGLNFKSVEALSSGKLLFTNTLGVQCLSDENMAFICDSPEEILCSLKKLELNKEFQLQSFKNGQKRALAIFSDENAYQALKKLISNNIVER